MRKRHKDGVLRSIKDYVTSPSIAYSYDRHYEDTPLLKYDSRFIAEELPPEGLLLDIGCGTGRHLIELARHTRRCVGMDLSAHMIDLSRAKLEHAGVSCPLVMASMTAPLPFADAAFDHAICMFSTIGLVPGSDGRQAFVAEVRRVLKSGGRFILHVHNRLHNVFSAWGRRWLLQTYVWDRLFSDLEVGDRIMDVYRGIENMYLHVFSLGEVRRLLEAGGFEVVRVAYLNDLRDGEIPPGRFASLRANGFLISARRT